MKKIIFCLIVFLSSFFACFAENYLLNNQETYGSGIRLSYFYDDAKDVFSIKRTNWKHADGPVFDRLWTFSKEQETVFLNTIKKYKEWLESYNAEPFQESVEKEIPNSKLIISGIEYYFVFSFTYYSGRRNYPDLIIKSPNKNGKQIAIHVLSEQEMAEVEKYFNRNYFNENKDNIIAKQEKDKEFVTSVCNKSYDFLKSAEESLNINDFDNAKKFIDEAEDALYEPWRAGPVNLEYIYSISTNPKKELETSKILSKCNELETELKNKKKKFETEKANNALQ